MNNKLKIAVFGCGRMGLHHVKAIDVLGFADLVAVADPYIDEAEVRDSLPATVLFYSDPAELLRSLKPDVVHIVTPPNTHLAMAKLALEYGAHIYVEKPFALNSTDAQLILEYAQKKNRNVCAGHQVLFQHSGQKFRNYMPIIKKVVHIESYFSFKTVRRVGGGMMSPVDQLMDILPHPIYLMLAAYEWSDKDNDASQCTVTTIDVDARGEVRVLLKQGDTPAMLVVTLRGRPIESYLHIVGTNGSLWVDFVISGVARLLGPGVSAISAVLNPFIRAKQNTAGTIANVYRMLTRKHKSYAGLAELINAFHHAIANGAPSPVSPFVISETVRLCELIGTELETVTEHEERRAEAALASIEAALPSPHRQRGIVLVTGGTGFLGRAVLKEVRDRQWAVRAVARRIPSARDRVPGVEYVLGDVSQILPDAVFSDVVAIIHLAAETVGDKGAHERNTITATRLLLESASKYGITRFLHTSSIAVLKPSYGTGGPLTETSSTDVGNIGRGPYVWGKAAAESLVTEYCTAYGIDGRQIRLGPLVDWSNFTPPGRLGREVGPFFVAMGMPGNMLDVCDVNTAAQVIRYYLEEIGQTPHMLNLVESPQVTRGDLVRRLKAERPELALVWLPFPLLRGISVVVRLILRMLKPGSKPLDVYSAFASERYDSSLAEKIISKAKSTPSGNSIVIADVEAPVS